MTALAAPVAAATTTETFQVDADTYIRWGGAVGDTNYGTSTSLFIRQSGDPWGASAGTLYRSLIRFNLSSIPEGATIESATLYGYMPARTGDREVAAYRVTGAWTETGVTWNTRPSNATQPTSVIDPGPTTNAWVGWNVTQDVQAYVQGTPNHGWLLAAPDESATSTEQRSQLRSREYSDSALRPYLNVTYSTGGAAPVLTVIEVSPAMTNLAVGGTQQFTATAKDQDGIEISGISFDWLSSNETVGTVNETGYFTALAAGTTTVTAAAEGVNGSAMVTTGATPALTTIEVSPETVNLAIGGTRQFNATAKDSAGSEISGVSFDWLSSNETVGTVNETGYFTALAAGTTTVTAAAEGVTGTAQVTVGPAAQADLTIAGVVNPAVGSAVFAREPNPVVVRNIRNNGEADATDVVVAVYASDVANGTVAVNTTTIETIPAGSQIAVTNILDPTIRDLQGGTVRYSAAVDPDNLIPETDETNNFKLGFADKSVLYNGYKGKTYWEGGSNVTTARTYDIRGDIVHSFGDSQYMSGSFGTGGWTNYTVTWTAGNLSLPEGATVHDAWLYVPYCWDNSNQAPNNVSIDFNGVRVPYVDWYHDMSNFGMYSDHVYGLMTYNVTDLYEAGANNTALFTRTDAGAKISPAGFTLAVIYEDDSAARKQIFVNEEFDILGADPQNYGTNMTEATAYVPFSGMTIEKEDVVRANLTTFVPWGNDGEGNLYFNGEQVGAGVWNFGPRTVGASDNSQVAVDEREVTTHLNATGNEAAIQGDETWKSPTMVAGLTFLVVEYADDTAVPTANFTANVTAGEAPLAVQFNDTSTGSPTSWAWDFENDGTIDSTGQNPVWTYTAAGTYTVNLTVANAAGNDSEVKTGYITVTGGGSPGGEAPVAAFTATPMNGLAPLSVTFTDASTNSPTAWSWESRPSGTDDTWTEFSTDRNATYDFAAGAYDIRLTVSNADGSDTLTKTQYISSSAGAKRLATVQSGTVSGDLYVGAGGGFGSGTSETTNTLNQTFTLPAYTDVQWARLYTVVYAAGTDSRAGTATVRFDGDGDGTYDTLGTETLDTAADNTATVYPVNDHVNRQYSDYLLWYDVTDLIGSQNPKAEVVSTPVASNFDGRIKELALVVAYNDGDGDEVHYWVNDGHDYQASGAGGVTSTFATGGLAAGWTDATLQNVMLSSKDALYTFNGAAYTGTTPSGYFGTNTWDVRNNLTAGSDSNFMYVLDSGAYSYKTTLATLAVKYPAGGGGAPVADFETNVTAGEAPLAVQFNDTSTGSPTSWAWDFGDNTTSAEQHPVHTYATAGTYSVNLTVTNAAGSDTETKTDYITVTAPSGGDVPDLTVSTLASNNGEVFSAAGNTYTATITNIGTGDTGAFSVEFNVSGVAGTVTVTDGLAAGANTTVTWTDETVRNAGDTVTITAVADPDGLIGESNEENNLASIEKTVVHNGYRGMRWTDGEDIATVATYDVRGDLLWSGGDGADLSAGTNWADYTVTWTENDLPVPANATIEGARLYVPYTWDKGPVFPENVTLTFNDVPVEQAAFYEDEKGWGTSSYPCGTTVYDVTDLVNPEGNTATLTNTFPGGGNVSVRGMLLAVVYDDGTTDPHTVIMNEGFDLLYGGEAQGTTPEEATAYAPFTGTIDIAGVRNATLITVAPGAGPTKGELIFNGETWTNVWNYTGTSQIGVDERNVTALLLPGENTAAFQSSADWMEAAAAFLVVEYPAPPGSIFVTSTPAGAAVWLDGEDTGEVTPVTLENVPAGDHVVTLKLDGYANASTPVTVAEGEMAEIDLALTDRIGCLEVTSTPDGAEIFIDGEDMGEVTNATIDGVGVGNHNVTLRKGGYVDAVAGVTITENETATLHLTLIEATGSIAVTSTPTGATIWIDGIETGRTTDATLTDIPAGEHTVTVKIAGYADAATNVTVEHGETVPVHLGLVPLTGSIAVTSIPDGARIFLDGTETGEMTNTTLVNVPPGDHTVRVELDGYQTAEEILTVTAGETVSCHLDLDRVMVMPVADFSADGTSGDAPLVVRFTDASTGNATAWAWDFGDGETSTDQNPIHAYLTAGTYTVTQTVTNADGSNSTAKTDYITVTLPQGDRTADAPLDIPGCTLTPASDGKTQVGVNTSETDARVSGNTIIIPQAAYTLMIETEDAPTVENGTVSGTIATIRLDTQPVVTELGSVGAVSASVSVDLTGLPDGAGLTTTVSQEISPDARSAFQLAAGTDGLNLGDVAYTMNIMRTNLENGQDIAGATIRMTVSPAWVEAHGGVDAIRIIRSAEDGTKEVLATRLVGTDAGGNMVFEAASPNGLSLFGLATVSATPQTTQSPASSGGGSSSTAVSAASTLKPGESVTLTMDRTAVSAVTLTANSAVNDVMVTMAKGSLPRTAELPAGAVYQYVEATLYKAVVEDFSGILFRFAVPNTWLAEHGCTAGEVALFRNTGNRWQEIPVEVLDEENGKAVFTANTGGFGLFAITAAGTTPGVGSPTPEPGETETPVGTETAGTTAPPADETQATPRPTPLPVWTALLALGLLFFLVRRD
ncbi:DUF3344 domain-containing protein [Methanoculleus palmolei]|uniref:DUF3344 domain-containing protein n=1 Tax=Methanoculleus palmolei TaxID=72612 RepID=A0ABD8A7K1_9EURY|nr:DUF3344 domain-containing protein [Methanoculleus palmolei]